MDESPTAINISKTDIKKFRALWLQKFGTRLSEDEARKKLLLLVRQVEIVHSVTSNDESEDKK